MHPNYSVIIKKYPYIRISRRFEQDESHKGIKIYTGKGRDYHRHEWTGNGSSNCHDKIRLKIIAKIAPATFKRINTSYNQQPLKKGDVKKKKKRFFRIKKV